MLLQSNEVKNCHLAIPCIKKPKKDNAGQFIKV